MRRPLQIVSAMCAIANGGTLMMPQIVHEITDRRGQRRRRLPPQEVRRVASTEAANSVRDALVRGGQQERHGAARARPGLQGRGQDRHGAKSAMRPAATTTTNTSFRSSVHAGGRSRLRRARLLDEAQTQPDQNYGGLVAAPVFSRIARARRAVSRPHTVARAKWPAAWSSRRPKRIATSVAMKLDALLSATSRRRPVDGPLDREITSIAYDSRRVKPGYALCRAEGREGGRLAVRRQGRRGRRGGRGERDTANSRRARRTSSCANARDRARRSRGRTSTSIPRGA